MEEPEIKDFVDALGCISRLPILQRLFLSLEVNKFSKEACSSLQQMIDEVAQNENIQSIRFWLDTKQIYWRGN